LFRIFVFPKLKNMPDKTTAKTAISHAHDYREIGEFWDVRDATEYGEEEPAEFEVDTSSQRRYFAIKGALYPKIRKIADHWGVSEGTFLNTIVQERIEQIERAL